jgi:ATP-dependent RNA helicase DDX27
VQSRAIPHILSGHDVCATAITGSGKSIAFLIPIIHQLLSHRGRPGPKALIMTPTRELAQQLNQVCQSIAKYASITSALVIGGSSNETLAAALNSIPDIIVATPGRIVDQHFNSKTITAQYILFLVLDEADRLLDRGFEAEITAISSQIPEKRQTLLFTATLSDDVSKLTHKILKPDAVKVSVDMFFELSPTLTQEFVKIKDDQQRMLIVIALCQNRCRTKTLVFLPTKQLAHEMSLLFNYVGIPAGELHADLPQTGRQQSGEMERVSGSHSRFRCKMFVVTLLFHKSVQKSPIISNIMACCPDSLRYVEHGTIVDLSCVRASAIPL